MEKVVYTLCSISVLFLLSKISSCLFSYRYNIISVLSAWWLFNLNLVIWNPNQYYQISFERLILYHSPLILFPLGYIIGIVFIGKSKLKSKPPNLDLPVKVNQIFSQRLALCTLVANFLFSLFIFYSAMRIAITFGLELQDFRNYIIFEAESIGGLFRYFNPISWLSGGLALYTTLYYIYYYLFSTEKGLGFNLLLSVLTIILNNLSTGGRQIILDVGFLFVSILIILSSMSRINSDFRLTLKNKNIYKKITYCLLFILLIIAIVSWLRKGSGGFEFASFFYTLIDEYIVYFTAPFFAFDQLFDTGRIESFFPDRFGYSFLGFDTVIVSGFLRFLNVSSFLGFGEISSILSQTSYSAHNGVLISDDLSTNAFYTLFLGAYIDGGYTYSYLLPFGLGFIYSIVNYEAVKNFSFPNFSLIIFSYYYLFNSVRFSLFQSPGIAIFLILIFLAGQIYSKRKANQISLS
jgi:oligosaccharide repeat unit polymerase